MADFNEAIAPLLVDEGGYVNDPNDPGGETKYGISKRSFPTLDIANLTVEDAKAIYQRNFWLFDGVLSQPVANKLFNEYVNMEHEAIKMAQRALAIAEDGIFGLATLKAVNAEDPVSFLQRYRNELVDFYLRLVEEKPEEGVFLNGWLRRARS